MAPEASTTTAPTTPAQTGSASQTPGGVFNDVYMITFQAVANALGGQDAKTVTSPGLTSALGMAVYSAASNAVFNGIASVLPAAGTSAAAGQPASRHPGKPVDLSVSLGTFNVALSSAIAVVAAPASNTMLTPADFAHAAGQLTSTLSTAITAAAASAATGVPGGVTATRVPADSLASLAPSLSAAVTDAIGASVVSLGTPTAAPAAPAAPFDPTSVYTPVYQVVYNTICAAAGQPHGCLLPKTPAPSSGSGAGASPQGLAVLTNLTAVLPAAAAPSDCPSGSVLCLQVIHGRLRANPLTTFLLVMGGLVLLLTLAILGYAAWGRFCVDRGLKPMMELNY